jgi:hypothetical protein
MRLRLQLWYVLRGAIGEIPLVTRWRVHLLSDPFALICLLFTSQLARLSAYDRPIVRFVPVSKSKAAW